MANYEIYDINADLEGVEVEEIREESQSKKFFLSKLSFENLKRICSKVRYFGNRGMKNLSDKISTVKEEIDDTARAKATLERQMETAPEIKDINRRIETIHSSNLDEDDKIEALKTPMKEKEVFEQGMQEEIEKLENLQQKKEQTLEYLSDIRNEKQEKIIKKAEEKRSQYNVFDDIEVHEQEENKFINNNIQNQDVDMDTVNSISEQLQKQGEELMAPITAEPNFAGLVESFNNVKKELEDVLNAVVALEEGYKKYTVDQIKTLKTAHSDAVKRLKENYEEKIREIVKTSEEDKRSYSVEVSMRDKEIEVLKAKNRELSQNLDSALNQVRDRDGSIIKLEEDNKHLNQEIATRDMKIRGLNQEKEKAKSENAGLREILEKYKKQNAMLRDQNSMLESQNKVLSENNKTLSEQAEGLMGLVEQFNTGTYESSETLVDEPGISMIKK